MHRLGHIIAILGFTVAVSLKPAPHLMPDETVGSDLRSLAQETWQVFLDVFRARRACFGDVHLHASRDLNSRGAYDPAAATVTVRVPATAAMLRGALIHEWAHHIEAQCSSHQRMRPAFLLAQKLPKDMPWQTGDSSADIPERDWAQIPSEQYAEAAIELVLGERQIPTTARIRPEAVDVLAEWASGK